MISKAYELAAIYVLNEFFQIIFYNFNRATLNAKKNLG